MRLPEFGNIEFGWGMCPNSMCANFGVLYGAVEGPGSYDLRYKLRRNKHGRLLGLRCVFCNLSIELHSPKSLRSVAQHFLSESLPFACCRDPACDNHGVNAFECYGRSYEGRGSPYGQGSEFQMTCNLCGKSFSLGSAFGRTDTLRVRRKITSLIHSVAMGRPVTDAIESGHNPGSYYPRVLAIGRVLRDYLAYRNALLIKPSFGDLEKQSVRVYTDVIQLSLNKLGEGPTRSQLVDVIVSAIKTGERVYILAAHACFIPDSKLRMDLHELEADSEIPDPLERRWDALITFLDEGSTLSDDDIDAAPDLADEGFQGQLVRSPYAEVAHFLVVNRMLARFGRRYHYMDGSRVLFTSALIAMRNEARSGRVQIASFQYKKGREAQSAFLEKPPERVDRPAALKVAFDEVEAAFSAALEQESPVGNDGDPDPNLAATVWRRAFVGANRKAGGWAWLKFPPDSWQYPHSRILWLTRKPRDTLEDGEYLLLGATLQPVDSAHASMRSKISSAERPQKVSVGIGFRDSYYRPDVVIAEYRVYMLYYNFLVRRTNWLRRKKYPNRAIPRAVSLGLAAKRDHKVKPNQIVWDFRLGVKHAKEISRWMTYR